MTASPPSTADLHPGYPYREQTDHDDDIPNRRYVCPYIAAKVDPITGEPRVLGRADKEAPTYDEGPLHATEVSDNDDMEEEVGEYPFGENAYLDPNFLEAMGTIADRGLASEGLRLVQLDGEKRFLRQWETRLKRRERAIHVKRTDYIRSKEKMDRKQTDVYHRLRGAKAASRLAPLLPDRNGQPGMSFPSPTRPYNKPDERTRRTGACHWCGRNRLDMHQGRDCEDPHTRCRMQAPGRCVVPDHHGNYYSHIDAELCPYNGNNNGIMARSEHA